mmetsp:Transcript_23732/g.65867  ORF Transcript_23732/g.65867 Transcript_23732/m.65867 type:complete len:228 (-) Transcript_23732:280-963(-)
MSHRTSSIHLAPLPRKVGQIAGRVRFSMKYLFSPCAATKWSDSSTGPLHTSWLQWLCLSAVSPSAVKCLTTRNSTLLSTRLLFMIWISRGIVSPGAKPRCVVETMRVTLPSMPLRLIRPQHRGGRGWFSQVPWMGWSGRGGMNSIGLCVSTVKSALVEGSFLYLTWMVLYIEYRTNAFLLLSTDGGSFSGSLKRNGTCIVPAGSGQRRLAGCGRVNWGLACTVSGKG